MLRQLQSSAELATTTYFASNLDVHSDVLLVILVVLTIILAAFIFYIIKK
jgi:hypothetical protein